MKILLIAGIVILAAVFCFVVFVTALAIDIAAWIMKEFYD